MSHKHKRNIKKIREVNKMNLKFKSILIITMLMTQTTFAHDLVQARLRSPSYIQTNLIDKLKGGEFVELDSVTTRFIEWKSDNTLIINYNRQVGYSMDATLPYPTICNYRVTANIIDLYERTDEQRKAYFGLATHKMTYQYKNVEILENENNDNACGEFAKRSNEKLPSYTEYFEILDYNASVIRIHSSGGGAYQQGGKRTSGDLDEVFVRQ